MTIDDAIIQGVIAESAMVAENAGIATVEESVLSGAIEASLESSRQEPQEQEQEGDDIRLDAINEDDQNGTGVEKCDHVKNAVKQTTFRRLMGRVKNWDHCQGCRDHHSSIKASAQKLDAAMLSPDFADATGDSVEALPADALWMCLTCCNINCGLPSKRHAKAHHRTKGHDHPLSINLASLDCW